MPASARLGDSDAPSSSGGKHYAIRAPLLAHWLLRPEGEGGGPPGQRAWGQARAWKALWLLVVRPVLLIF